MTDSIKLAIDETKRRRKIQHDYNVAHNITPTSVKREIGRLDQGFIQEEEKPAETDLLTVKEIEKKILSLKGRMRMMAQKLNFEEAARARDEISELRKKLLAMETGEY